MKNVNNFLMYKNYELGSKDMIKVWLKYTICFFFFFVSNMKNMTEKLKKKKSIELFILIMKCMNYVEINNVAKCEAKFFIDIN